MAEENKEPNNQIKRSSARENQGAVGFTLSTQQLNY